MKKTKKYLAILLSVLMIATLMPWTALAEPTGEAYVVYKSENQSLYFVRGTFDGDSTVTRADNSTVKGIVCSGVETAEGYAFPQWQWYLQGTEYVYFLDVIKPKTTYEWFNCAYSLKDIYNFNYLDTSETTVMRSMFANTASLSKPDLSGFDTSNVTDMYTMFGKSGVTQLDLSSFDTSHVTNMYEMFYSCGSLSSITFGDKFKFVVSADGDAALPEPQTNDTYTGKWARITDGEQDHDMLISSAGLMANPENLAGTWVWETTEQEPPVLTGDAYAVYDPTVNTLYFVRGTYNGTDTVTRTADGAECKGIVYKDIEITDYSTGTVVPWNDVKEDVKYVKFLDEVKPITTDNWFCHFSGLTQIYELSLLNTENVTSMYGMFEECYALESLDLSGFKTSNVTTMEKMFADCRSLKSLDLSCFDTTGLRSVMGMFNHCDKLESLDISSFDSILLSDGSFDYFFSSCTALSSITMGAKWKFSAGRGDLPGITADETYTGKWVKLVNGVQDHSLTYTSSELLNAYSGDMAGTWVWETRSEEPPVPTGEAYAVYDASDAYLHFVRGTFDGVDTVTRADNSTIQGVVFSGVETDEYLSADQVPWAAYRDDFYKVDFADLIRPVSTAHWFENCTNLSYFANNHPNLDTSLVTNMEAMFANSGIEYVYLELFDTSNVSNMTDMFKNCGKLYMLHLGDGFRFVGGTAAALPDAPSTGSYTGKWVLGCIDYCLYSQVHETARTAAELMETQDIGYSTWVWETAPGPADYGEAYAVYTSDTLVFCRGTLNPYGSGVIRYDGTIVDGQVYSGVEDTSTAAGGVTWQNADIIKYNRVIFVDPIRPKTTACWFTDFLNLEHVYNTYLLDTSDVTDMSAMFCGTPSLRELDVSGFNTANVTNMVEMFNKCGVTRLDLSSFDTSRVTDMAGFFLSCDSLSSLTFGDKFKFVVSAGGDAGLPEPQASDPYTGMWARVTDGEQDHDTLLSSAELMANPANLAGTWEWESNPPEVADGAFVAAILSDPAHGGKPTAVFLNGQSVDGVLYRNGEVFECDAFLYGGDDDTPGFMNSAPAWQDMPEYTSMIETVVFLDELKPTSTAYWFNGFKNLTVIEGLEKLDTSAVTDMAHMFLGCEKLTALDLSTFDTSNVTNMEDLVADCSALVSLDLSSFDMSCVTSIEGFIKGCGDLKRLVLGENTLLTHFENDLVTPYGDGYTGKWVRLDPVTGEQDRTSALSSYDLATTYNGATMAGIWVWETVCDHANAYWKEAERKDSTCTVAGWVREELVCPDCGETLDERTRDLPLADHTPGDAVKENETPATCTEPGSYDSVVYCKADGCGAEIERKPVTVPALGHDWSAWEIVREATFEEDGLEKRTCGRCGETEQRVIEWQGVANRLIQFVVSYPMHYVVHMRNVDYSIYSDTTPAIYWYDDHPLTFSVVIYSTWSAQGYVVSANGKEIKPDANGNYTIPAGTDRVQINCDPIATPATNGQDVCEYCGKIHPSTAWGFLIGLVHRLFAFFKNMGR